MIQLPVWLFLNGLVTYFIIKYIEYETLWIILKCYKCRLTIDEQYIYDYTLLRNDIQYIAVKWYKIQYIAMKYNAKKECPIKQ